MRKRPYLPKNWISLAKEFSTDPLGEKSLWGLYQEGSIWRGTLWSMLFSGTKGLGNKKPVKQSLLDITRATEFTHMTNEEILLRDREWAKRYPSKLDVAEVEEEALGALGDQYGKPMVAEEEDLF